MIKKITARKTWLVCLLSVLMVVSCIGMVLAVFADGSVAAARAETLSPSSLWETSGDITLAENVGADERFSQPGNGLAATFALSNSTLRYKNPIDVSKNTKNDELLSFTFLPSEIGVKDYKYLEISLTDSADPDNVVTLRMMRTEEFIYDGVSYDEMRCTLSYPGSASLWRAVTWGAYDAASVDTRPEYGLRVYYSMVGLPHVNVVNDPTLQGKQLPFTVRYDWNERALYVCNEYGSPYMVLDMDDPLLTGAGNEWGGFQSKNIYLDITIRNLLSTEGSILIYGVNGNSMAGNTVSDEKAPSLEVAADAYTTLPYAQNGKAYPVFSATASDEIDGDLTDEIEVTVTDPDGKTTACGEAFTPQKSGEHLLTYAVRDAAGNESVAKYTFTSRVCPDDLALTLSFEIDEERVWQIGGAVPVPAAEVSGGTEQGLTLERQVTHLASGREYAIEENSFIPDVAGVYRIRYTVTDYIGTEKVFDRFITTERGKTPVTAFMDESEYPKALIGGKTTELPVFESYDHVSAPGIVLDASRQISYRYAGETDFTPLEGVFFTPDASKTSVSIRYEYWCGAEKTDENCVWYTYEVPIRQAEQVGDYFVTENAKLIYSNASLEFAAQDTGKDVGLEFVNVLSVDPFRLVFDIAQHEEEGETYRDISKNNFDSLTIRLTDAADPTISLTFTIVKNDPSVASSKCDLYFGGVRYEVSGTFSYDPEWPNAFDISYDNSTRILKDNTTGVRILTAQYDDAGRAFTGFPSRSVRMQISLNGVAGESSVLVSRIVNQRVNGRNVTDGVPGQPFKDNADPYIIYDQTVSRDGNIHTNHALPGAVAFDVLDPYVSVALRVTSPSGDVLYEGDAADGASFYIGEYGLYTAIYTAADSAGNEASNKVFIEVVDKEAPQLLVFGDITETATVGNRFIVPSASAYDNLTAQEEMIVWCFVTDPLLHMRAVQAGDEVGFERAGTYTVTYSVTDAAGNTSVSIYKISVRG